MFVWVRRCTATREGDDFLTKKSFLCEGEITPHLKTNNAMIVLDIIVQSMTNE